MTTWGLLGMFSLLGHHFAVVADECGQRSEKRGGGRIRWEATKQRCQARLTPGESEALGRPRANGYSVDGAQHGHDQSLDMQTFISAHIYDLAI